MRGVDFMADQDMTQKLMEMIQEIRETVVSMDTNMKYAQQNQTELKNQINDINKKFEEYNTKILELTNQQNNNNERLARVEKWGNIIATTVAGAILAAILALVIK